MLQLSPCSVRFHSARLGPGLYVKKPFQKKVTLNYCKTLCAQHVTEQIFIEASKGYNARQHTGTVAIKKLKRYLKGFPKRL
ncbi:hypothetical protein ABKN59_003885 [Abortiporus biennis]